MSDARLSRRVTECETIIEKMRPIILKCLCMTDDERQTIEALFRRYDNAHAIIKRRKTRVIKARPIDTSKKSKQCQWPGCGMVFRDRQDLQNHMWRHTGEKLYQCDWDGCGKRFSAKAYLKKHRDAHTDPFRFKCEFPKCESAFMTPEELSGHLDESHDGTRPYRCDLCNKQKHIYAHKEQKRLMCSIPTCTETFTKRSQLLAHECGAHGEEKPFKCDWPGCEYDTCYEQTLRTHRLRHTGEKPFKCQWPHCDWSFRRSHHLQVHMLKHTGEKPFACDWPGCDRKFQSRQTLRIHCDKTHK